MSILPRLESNQSLKTIDKISNVLLLPIQDLIKLMYAVIVEGTMLFSKFDLKSNFTNNLIHLRKRAFSYFVSLLQFIHLSLLILKTNQSEILIFRSQANKQINQ